MMRDPYKEYMTNQMSALEGRALESTVLQLMSNKLMLIVEKWDSFTPTDLETKLKEVLDRNKLLWELFQRELKDPSNQNTPGIKSKLLTLSVFIMKTTLEIYLKPNRLQVKLLAEINHNISMGLAKKI